MFANPMSTLDALGVSPGMTVGDFGTGAGAYAEELSRRVGKDGIVYAFDVQKDLVTRLDARAKTEGITNIRAVWADLEMPHSTSLENDSLDVVIVANALFQIEEKDAFLTEVARVVRPKGRVLIVDWSDSWGHLGPSPENVILPDVVKQLAKEAGLTFDKQIDAGEHHYGLLFRASEINN